MGRFVSSSGPLLDPSILSCKGVFTRICVLYYLGPILAVSYLNVRLLEIWVVTHMVPVLGWWVTSRVMAQSRNGCRLDANRATQRMSWIEPSYGTTLKWVSVGHGPGMPVTVWITEEIDVMCSFKCLELCVMYSLLMHEKRTIVCAFT